MADIDLIPSDYRRSLALKKSLVKFAMACAGLIAVTFVSHIAVTKAVGVVQADVTKLQAQQKITTQQRNELTRWEGKKKSFEHQLALLQGLRSGAAAEKMFATIDRALEGNDVWFLSWEFQRAGEKVDEAPKTVNTGYFIVVPASEGRKKTETWKINTHMSIKGQANDHAALSRFVRRLINQPEIQDIRILRTGLKDRGNSAIVDFEMAVVVNSGAVTG